VLLTGYVGNAMYLLDLRVADGRAWASIVNGAFTFFFLCVMRHMHGTVMELNNCTMRHADAGLEDSIKQSMWRLIA